MLLLCDRLLLVSVTHTKQYSLFFRQREKTEREDRVKEEEQTKIVLHLATDMTTEVGEKRPREEEEEMIIFN